jgi:peptidoglycan hydrolase-like protein with peptidoglycan-binding domain
VYVCVLQDALSTLGVELSGIDGVFGPSTKAAVMAYQRGNGLAADGIVGCGTWRRLTAAANGLTRNSGRFPATYIDW